MQSTALALMSCENALRGQLIHPDVPIYDAILFCDLGAEPAWVYAQVAFIQNVCKTAGIPFYILRTNLYGDYLQNFGRGHVSNIPWWTLSEAGKRGKLRRHCTLDYKIIKMQQFIKYELLGYRRGQRLRPLDAEAHEMHIGFSAEEAQRIFDSRHPLFKNRFPLADMGWTRREAYGYTLEVWGLATRARETRAKDGYLLDDTPQTAKIKANETITLEFRNQPKGNLIVLKKDSVTGAALQGVTFKITYADGSCLPDEGGKLSSNGLYTTDQNGKITLSGVTGTLVVTETQTIPGYTIDEAAHTQTVVVNPGDTQTLTFTNTPTTTLVIQKFIEGSKNSPIPGVEFLVTDSSGAVVGPNNGKYTTDANGRIAISGLNPGVTVTAKETKTAEGFVLDGSPQSIQKETFSHMDYIVYNLVMSKTATAY